MAKQSGLGDNGYVAGYDLSGDIAALTRVGGGPAALEVTGIDKYAFERIGGLRTGEIAFNVWFNKAAGQSHLALRGLPTADVHVMYCRGTTLGKPAACLVSKQINYDWARGNDGSLQGVIQALSNGYGLSWGRLLTAGKRTDTGATNGSSIDDAASSAFGLAAFLQVFSFVGTDATVKIQESSDNGGADPWADVVGGGFTQINAGNPAPLTQRIVTSLTLAVERYLRVITITTGGFTSLVFAVAVARHDTAIGY